MKKGRISKEDERYIQNNINKSLYDIARSIDRDPESVKSFIEKKVAKGVFQAPEWLNPVLETKAKYDLIGRPYYREIKQQFTENELELFEYHWSRIISQFKDDVTPTEELQVVDLIKLELLMNRSLKHSKDNIQEISEIEDMVRQAREDGIPDRDLIFNLERQIGTLRAAQQSLNTDYRDLQTKKNAMLKEMKATRDQRVRRFEDSKTSFVGFMNYLLANPDVTREYGIEMEQMRLAAEKERERLSTPHMYQDNTIDIPFLTPETINMEEK